MQQRILYLSTIQPGLSRPDVQHLVAMAQRLNRQLDVTGVLAMGRRLFAQVLEGDCESLRTLMTRIAGDHRHADLRVVLREDSDHRLFQRWSMALLSSEALDEQLSRTFDGDAHPDELLRKLLEEANEDAH